MSEIVKHPKCGKSWIQRGNRTGHCAACHETFEGASLFDAHQRVSPDGTGAVTCSDPIEMEFPKGFRLKQGPFGTWSTTKPSHFTKEKK